jgi:hypothetical protein
MWQKRELSKHQPSSCDTEGYRRRMRANLLAAIVTAILLTTGAWLADELGEASQSCYRPDGGCEAWGVPIDQIGFADLYQQ